MKGVVFTEFFEMVEEKFSPEVADQIIEASDLPSGGIYTAVGTYDHNEMVQLVAHLSETTGIAVPDLLRTFGQHVFFRFYTNFPQFFEGVHSAFEFLSGIEGYIHVEVRKLYPDAELPTFEHELPQPERMILIYSSTRPFADFAEGLILGCIEYFGEAIDLVHEDLSGGKGTSARFILTKREAAQGVAQ